ncbi:MAG: hypothetical protein AAFR76_03195 [Planctomycetota bacterium]
MGAKKPTLMRSLGRFVGEIGKAVRGPTKQSAEVSRTTESETRETDQGTVTLRRTTVEEIEVVKPTERS